MEIAKVLEILSKHIIKIEEENQFKDWEIKRLNEKLNNGGKNENIKKN